MVNWIKTLNISCALEADVRDHADLEMNFLMSGLQEATESFLPWVPCACILTINSPLA